MPSYTSQDAVLSPGKEYTSFLTQGTAEARRCRFRLNGISIRGRQPMVESDIISGDILTITEMAYWIWSVGLKTGVTTADDAWDKMDNGPTVNSMDLSLCLSTRGRQPSPCIRRSHSGASSRALGPYGCPRQTLKILTGMAT